MGLNIDKGILKSYLMLAILVALIGSIFILIYVWAIVGGAIFYTANPTPTVTSTAVTNESFIASNVTAQALANSPIVVGTLSIYNRTNGFEWGLSNFTIVYSAGTILTVDNETIPNNGLLSANYTYTTTTTPASLPVTNGTTNFLSDTETSFFTNLGYVKTSLAFVGALIAVAIVLLVFGSFIKTGKDLFGKKGKGKGGNLSY